MGEWVAVMLCDDKYQMIIPEEWFAVREKRRIFYSPFGDGMQADFSSPVQPRFRDDISACYFVRFVKALPTKESCIEYVQRRRCITPVVYNDRRLLEIIPELGAAALNNDVPVAEAVVVPVAEAVIAFNVADGAAAPNIGNDVEFVIEFDDETNFADVAATSNIGRNANGTAPITEAVGATAPVAPKIENKNAWLQLIEDNLNEETPFIDLSNDPEEQAAMIAVENNDELNDSDDEILAATGIEAAMPLSIKFDFDTMDILSGNMPFEINVRLYICKEYTQYISQFFFFCIRLLKEELILIARSL